MGGAVGVQAVGRVPDPFEPAGPSQTLPGEGARSAPPTGLTAVATALRPGSLITLIAGWISAQGRITTHMEGSRQQRGVPAVLFGRVPGRGLTT